MIVMKEGATEEQIAHVVERIEEVGCSAHLSKGELLTVIGAIGDRDRVAALGLEGYAGRRPPGADPEAVQARLGAVQEGRADRDRVDGRKIGGDHFGADRRPVHGREPRADARDRPGRRASTARRCCAAAPTSRAPRRTASRASGSRACACSQEAKEETGLPIVTELMDVRDVDDVVEVADVIQIGARNMQNYTLLTEVGRSGKAGAAQARPLLDARRPADGVRVRAQGGQPERDALRARHPHVRDRLPVHARPAGGPGAARADPPAGRRRPEPRAGAPRLGPGDVAGGGRGGRRRDHRRGPQRSRARDLRRPAGAADGGVRRLRRAGPAGRRGRRQDSVSRRLEP